MIFLFIFSSTNDEKFFGFAMAENAEYTFYTTQLFYDRNAVTIKNGAAYHVCCDFKNAKNIYKKLDKTLLKGQSFCFFSEKSDLDSFIRRLNISVLTTEQVDNVFIVNGYNSKFGDGVFVGKDYVNIQLAFSCGKITVGVPLILGSF